MQFRSNQFALPEITKNLIAINVIMYVATRVLFPDWYYHLGLHLFATEGFKPWQIVTSIFMHHDFRHLLFNMIGLWIFGTRLEQMWGSKRYLNFYAICGFGATLLAQSVNYYMYINGLSNPSFSVGASGAIYGLSAAFAMYWPNTEMQLLFIPVPIKAKYLVLGLVIISLVFGMANLPGDSIGHYAHLGGAIVGFLLVKYWNKTNRNSFY